MVRLHPDEVLLTWGPCGSWSSWRSIRPPPTSGRSAPGPDGTPGPETEPTAWRSAAPRRPRWRGRTESSRDLRKHRECTHTLAGMRDRTCPRRRKAYAFLALNTCCYGNQPFFYPTVCALDECCEAVWPSPPDSLLHRHTPLCVTDVFVLFYGSLRTFMNKHTFRPPFFWTIHASQEWYKSHKEMRFYVGK